MDPLAPLRTVGGRLALPAEALAQAIAERVIGLVIGALDLNALLAEIDLNALLAQIDLNALLAEIDLNAVLAQVGPHNDELRASGHFVTSQALTLPQEAVTVRVRDGKTSTTDGPFMETKELLGGLVVIEARDLNEAVRLAGAMPFAKLGAIEVRPVVDFSKPRPTL